MAGLRSGARSLTSRLPRGCRRSVAVVVLVVAAACSSNGSEEPPPPPTSPTTSVPSADADRESASGVVVTVDDTDTGREFIARHEGRTVRSSSEPSTCWAAQTGA